MKDHLDLFDLLTKRLAHEIRWANWHFHVFTSLQIAVRKHVTPFNMSRMFWGATMNAHLESCRVHLCRIYDTRSQGDTLGLLEWLREFDRLSKHIACREAHAETNHAEVVSEDSIQEDNLLVGKSCNLVKKLKEQRDKDVAHISKRYVTGQLDVVKKYPLSFKDIQTLIDRAKHLLNKYSTYTTGVSYNMSTDDDQDFEFVVEAITEKLERGPGR